MNLSPTHIAIVIALGVIGSGISIYRSRVAARRRRDQLAALAAELGWSFTPDRNTSHDNEFSQFGVFRRGSFRAASNTIDGSLTIDGRRFPCRMGDYSFHEGTGSSSHSAARVRRFSYLILQLPTSDLPSLRIRRENSLDRLKGALGFEGVDLGSAEFGRRFHVKCADRAFAAGVIHPEMMKWLMAVSPPELNLDGDALCLTDSTPWSPETFRRHMALAAQFIDRWPDHLTGGRRALAG